MSLLLLALAGAFLRQDPPAEPVPVLQEVPERELQAHRERLMVRRFQVEEEILQAVRDRDFDKAQELESRHRDLEAEIKEYGIRLEAALRRWETKILAIAVDAYATRFDRSLDVDNGPQPGWGVAVIGPPRIGVRYRRWDTEDDAASEDVAIESFQVVLAGEREVFRKFKMVARHSIGLMRWDAESAALGDDRGPNFTLELTGHFSPSPTVHLYAGGSGDLFFTDFNQRSTHAGWNLSGLAGVEVRW